MTGFFSRWAFAFILVAVTYNPTRYNYVSWVWDNWETSTSVAVLLGLLMTIAYIIYLRATLRSIGIFGMLLVGAVIAATVWVLYDMGWLSLEDRDLRLWIGILGMSFILGIGLSWSRVRRALSGQFDVDDVQDDETG